MAKRIVTKIGNVFCAEIDGKYKCFFQYIMNDITQLNSSVIRVFKRRYPMDYKPDIEEIVSDDVLFYAHTILRVGIEFGAWYKVGKSMNLGEEKCRKVLFGYTHDTIFDEAGHPHQIIHWMVWHLGEDFVRIKKLPEKYYNDFEDGSIFTFMDIIERIKYGFFTSYSDVYKYNIRRRIPFQHADIYVKKGYDNYSIPTYFYFHGNNLVRLVEIVDGKAICMTAEDIAVSNHKMRGVGFSDIWWSHDDFISEEEFERVWNGEKENNIKPYKKTKSNEAENF